MRNLILRPKFFNDFEDLSILSNLNQLSSPWIETEKSFETTLDIPGIKREDVKISLEEGGVRISAKREKKSKNGTQFSVKVEEFLYLPDLVDPNSIDAKLDMGVLTLTVQKTEKQTKVIEIK